ncbi:MAG: LytTR family DNA-binding domain-containing protein [Pseudomonadota bacterium]
MYWQNVSFLCIDWLSVGLLASRASNENGFGVNDMGKVANDTVIAETMAEAQVLAWRSQFWAMLLGAGAIIGLAGPFGTFDVMPLLVRTAYWVFTVVTTFWLGYLVSFAVTTRLEMSGFAAFISLGVGATASSVVVTIWLAGVHRLVFATPFWADFGLLFPYVLVICLTLAILSEATVARDLTTQMPAAEGGVPDWLERLPDGLGRNLIVLQAQDHYVRAETDLGETLIRATIHDATRDLGAYGVRLHRSWWVARGAIRAYQYRKGAPVVVLHDGRILPVGRTYRRAVRQALQ